MIIKLLKNSFLMKNLRIIRNKTNLIIFIIDISRYLFVFFKLLYNEKKFIFIMLKNIITVIL